MISIIALINVTEWTKNGDNDNDNDNDNYMRIEKAIYSVVEQTYKKWELRIVLYGSGNKNIDNIAYVNKLIYELKKYETKYNSKFDTDTGVEKDEYKIIIINYS